MRINIFLLLTATIMISSWTNATVWRVNSIPGVGADFASFNDAQNNPNVLPGDTLYIEPGAGTYGNITVTKRLVIIGNGFFLSENPETQANLNTSQFGDVKFNNGSQGSSISGCQIPYIQINTSQIVIERNYLMRDAGDFIIVFNTNNISDIIIRDNYISNNCPNCYLSTAVKSSASGVNNVHIYNNFIKVTHTGSQTRVLTLSSGFSGKIYNNVFEGNIEINNSEFYNNIQITGSFTQTNCTWTHNIGNSTQFGTENENKINVNMADVFVGPAGNSTDGQYQLKPGSPASGNGTGGTDRGMFGGQNPYVLSGIPGIPSIYYNEQVIDNVNQQINVNLKTKSNN